MARDEKLPRGWNLKCLADVATLVVSNVDKKIVPNERAVKLCNYTDVYYNRYIDSAIGFSEGTASEREIATFQIKAGDVLITKDSETSDDIAVPALVTEDMERVLCGYHLAIVRPDRMKMHAGFLSFLLQTKYMRHYFSKLANGVTRFGLTKESVEHARLPLPPPDEQAHIAGILRTWDSDIRQIEDLISAKLRLKRGLMQQLLTGKRRFGEFDEPWHTARLGEVGKCAMGGTPDTGEPHYWNGTLAWCTPTEVSRLNSRFITDTVRRITDSGLKMSSAVLLPPGSLLVTTRATIGDCAINKIPMATNQGFKSLIPNEKVDIDFLYYVMSQQKRQLTRYANGSTFFEVPARDFVNIMLHIPELAEQRKIAAVLSAADSEINLLRRKLELLKKQKRGLMEKLLTGKVRVKL